MPANRTTTPRVSRNLLRGDAPATRGSEIAVGGDGTLAGGRVRKSDRDLVRVTVDIDAAVHDKLVSVVGANRTTMMWTLQAAAQRLAEDPDFIRELDGWLKHR